MILNVDADEILYNAAFAGEKACYEVIPKNGKPRVYGNRYTRTEIIRELKQRGKEIDVDYTINSYKTSLGGPSFCRQNAKGIINRLSVIGEVRLFLTGPGNFRIDVAKTEGPRGLGYKANRPARPLHYAETREYLIERWGAKEVTGIEADDALGIYQSENTIAVHIDKDINRIVGKHLNWKTGERYIVKDSLGSLKLVNKQLKGTGNAFFFAQMLTGDNVDNIPGVDGIGPISAYNILSACKTEKDMLYNVLECYYNTYGNGSSKIMLEVADLLYIMDSEKIRGSEYIKRLLAG